MDMRRITITSALILAACFAAFAGIPDVPTINKYPPLWRTVASGSEFSGYEPDCAVRGYLDPATKTFSIPANTKVHVGALIPAGAQGARVRVYGGDVVFNSQLGLDGATGTFVAGDIIASGSVWTWDGPCRNGNDYCIPRTASDATGTLWCW